MKQDTPTLDIAQISGEPDFSHQHLDRRSHAEYVPGRALVELIQKGLVAERIAIESYGEMIRRLGDKDNTTRRLLEKILAVEEEHSEDLVSLVHGMKPAAAGDVPVREPEHHPPPPVREPGRTPAPVDDPKLPPGRDDRRPEDVPDDTNRSLTQALQQQP